MNNMHPQDSYDQLKRKNRRRLVGAVVMVAVAGTILLSVLKQTPEPATQQQEITFSGLVASDSAPPPLAAADDHAEDLAPGAVLEPVPVAEDEAAALAASEAEHAPKTVVVKPMPPSPSAKPAEPVVNSKSPEAPKSASKPEPAKVQRPAPSPATTVAEPKPATPKPATKADTKPATKADAPKPAAKPEAVNTGKLTPQDILNNKAAGQVAKSQPALPGPQAILNGQGGGKALIQVGAYTNEQQAAAVQQKLAAAGVKTTVSASQTSKGTLYRVRTATYASRAQAEQNLNRIRAQGLDGIVIGQ